MNPLEKLIGQKVYARIEVEGNEFQDVLGEVYSIDINDYYFYDKREPIYITVSINPLEELDENIDTETLASIPLDHIIKY